MGLFDYVKCELPLPKGQDDEHQTKDTDTQYMMHHVITKEGRLILKHYDSEETPKAERRYPNAPEGSLEAFFGCIRKKAGSERDLDQNFDGDLEFYCDEDYRATFRGGDCREICQLIEGQWASVWKSEVRA